MSDLYYESIRNGNIENSLPLLFNINSNSNSNSNNNNRINDKQITIENDLYRKKNKEIDFSPNLVRLNENFKNKNILNNNNNNDKSRSKQNKYKRKLTKKEINDLVVVDDNDKLEIDNSDALSLNQQEG